MRIPEPLRRYLLRRARRLMGRRPADFVIGADYLERWYVIRRNPIANIYLHLMNRSDDDRALHDHPWASLSIMLEGSYEEVVPLNEAQPAGITVKHPLGLGEVRGRRARQPHRLELPQEGGPVVTLFLTGPKVREWGFWCPHSWRYWKDYSSQDSSGRSRVGRGCD